MDIVDLIAIGFFVVVSHVITGLWHNRDAPGALPCIAFFLAVLAYLLGVLLHAMPVQLTWLSYVAGTQMAPLLFVATVEYGQLRPPAWAVWRWLLPGAAAVLAAWNVARSSLSDSFDVFAAIAAAPDVASRLNLISQVRLDQLIATTATSYGFLLVTAAVAAYRFLRAPRQQVDQLVLFLMLVLVAAADFGYTLAGVEVAGANPTSAVLFLCILVGAVALHRSRLFDVRPVARSLLVDSVQDAILVIDRRRRVVDHNQVARELVGQADLIGRTADSVLPREFAALLQSSVHLRSELAVRVDGSEAWFEVDATPLRRHGRSIGHLLIARDISERRMVQNALEESRRSLEAANARLVEQSVTDPLTGLKNRRFLFQRLSEELNRHHRSGASLGLLVLDLDHFKRVNDTHGHPVGDEALIQVATTLQRAVRDCDVVARLGGEEFAILAVNTEMDGLLHLAERLRQAVRASPVARESREPMTLTASIGVAAASATTLTPDGLFAEADSYLYAAKHQGRNQVVCAGSGARPEAAPSAAAGNAARTARNSAP